MADVRRIKDGEVAAKESSPETEVSYNVFRDSPLRYMGYANEVGESFRYQFPRMVVPSYALSFSYCAADAATTGHRVWTNHQKPENCGRSIEARVALATFDTLLWQSLASVVIPGATINVIVRASKFAVSRTVAPIMVKKWLPTVVGLGSIPLIIHPIDSLVDFSLDNTIRLWVKERK